MNRDEARQYILENSAGYFEPDKASTSGRKHTGYVCPICGSGTGPNGTGITTQDGTHFTCWRGCFSNADIFDIIGKQYGLSGYNEQLERACEIFHITLEHENNGAYNRPSTNAKPAAKVQNQGVNLGDVKEFLKDAARHIELTKYHRGISTETLKKFGVGYVSQWRVNENAPLSPRLIIPHSDGEGYLARDTRSNLTEQQARYAKIHQGHIVLFNPQALAQNNAPVFVVEGEIDTMSITDAGGLAVGLCGVANVDKLINAVKEKQFNQPLIIVPDNDKNNAGKKGAARLEEKLKALNFFFYRHELPKGYKDANDFLMNDRAAFSEWVQAGIAAARVAIDFQIDADRAEFEREAVAYYKNDFLAVLKKGREGVAIATGFSRLDDLLDGGLYPGLYFIGAISSSGKTASVLQVADNIARSGYGVLFFSLEMSRNELIARSISRYTAMIGSTKRAKTTREILRLDYRDYAEQKLIEDAANKYFSEVAPNMYITEGIGNIGVNEIRGKLERFLRYSGKPPVIVIDYAQILSPFNERATDKQNVDKNVLELKRISRDFEIPILAISSFNRENYNEPVSMASFKESGAIEYSSDVLIGLQYKGFDYEDKEKEADHKKRVHTILKNTNEAAKKGEAVEVQYRILKNRNGRKGTIELSFYPTFNYFCE